MREHKFRVWDKFKKRWVIFALFEKPIIADVDYYKLPVYEYTGLKDKNGKEIYEGDIIKQGKYIFEVRFEEIIDEQTNVFGWNINLYEDSDNIEVIGNIYEIPELLNI